jgi:hypothetical protein
MLPKPYEESEKNKPENWRPITLINSAKQSYLISHAVMKRRSLYIAALDCWDAFGSVFHQLLNVNLGKLGVPKRLENLKMDWYRNSQVRIRSNGKSSDPICIRKGVKQGCPLSPLLFDICADPLIIYI